MHSAPIFEGSSGELEYFPSTNKISAGFIGNKIISINTWLFSKFSDKFILSINNFSKKNYLSII